ncbi:MAG: START domain-containing protein [Pseudomonadota bacterium]
MKKAHLFRSMLMLAFLSCLACTFANAESGEWERRFSQDGLSVYTKHIEGAPIKSFRAEMIAEAPFQLVMSVLEDVQHYPDWFHLCRSYEVLQGSMKEGEYIGYYVVEAPWPLKDRDVYVKNRMSQDPETQTVTILTDAVPDFMPVKEEFTRVPEVYGRWTVRPVDSEHTYVEFIGHGHPGGIIPLWVANLVVTDVPKKTFENLRSLFEKRLANQTGMNERAVSFQTIELTRSPH